MNKQQSRILNIIADEIFYKQNMERLDIPGYYLFDAIILDDHKVDDF